MAKKTLILSLLSTAFLLIFSFNTFAQQKQGANWLFGGRIHLNFNDPKPTVENYAFTDTLAEAVATISDSNGNLLFFSSGGHVATRQKINGVYQEMPNGNVLAGLPFSRTAAEMIVQSLADSSVYYLFFLTPISIIPPRLYRVTIDMRLNNGYGDVVLNSLQLVRKDVNDMKLSVAMHSNNRDIWILTQNYYPNDSLIAHLLTPNGILPPVKTKINQRLGDYSRLKTSPNSEMFAVRGEFGVELFDFNRATGTATHKYSFLAPDPNYYQYCFAFSSDNTKFYTGTAAFSFFPNNTTVFQYDLSAGSASQVAASRNIIFNTSTYAAVGDMQLAMDGKIYLTFTYLVSGYPVSSQYLSQINCPNFYGALSGFKFNGLDLQRPIPSGILPALNQTLFRNAGKLQAQATQNAICEGDTLQLSAYGAGAEHFKWQAANGLSASSDTLKNPLVSPTVTTTYKVIGSSACRSDTAFVTVTVLPKIPEVTLSGPMQVTSLTKQEYAVQNPAPGSVFNWQISGGTIETGQGKNRIVVNWGAPGKGMVDVTEVPQTGCSGKTTTLKVKLTEGPPPIIYNLITPNNDLKNDAFEIGNLKWYPENELRIYNRWGQEVYKTSNYQNNWQAGDLSAGVYYYYFQAKGQSWKGWVEVLK